MSFSPDKVLVKQLKKIIKTDASFPRGSGWRARTLRDGQMVIYINKKLGMVVKAPMCVLGKEKEGITLPTVHLGFGWVLQPICTFEKRTDAVRELARKIGPEPWLTYDFHSKNVGRFEGKPYLFDW